MDTNQQMRIEILDDLRVVADGQVVGRLEPSVAFDLAERLVRIAMRNVMLEESSAALEAAADTDRGRQG